MKLFILNGASTAGKSTIINNLMKKDHLFHLSSDRLKWSFSNYNRNKHYKDVRKLVLAVADHAFKMKYDVLSDSTLYKESRSKLKNLAKKYKYQIIEINLDAEYDILLKRFRQRVKHPHKNTSNLSEKRFKELYDVYQKEKSKKAISIRTDKLSVDAVTKNVLKILRSKT